jgi:hypothetical protein
MDQLLRFGGLGGARRRGHIVFAEAILHRGRDNARCAHKSVAETPPGFSHSSFSAAEVS